jgi:hypothetical protein
MKATHVIIKDKSDHFIPLGTRVKFEGDMRDGHVFTDARDELLWSKEVPGRSFFDIHEDFIVVSYYDQYGHLSDNSVAADEIRPVGKVTLQELAAYLRLPQYLLLHDEFSMSRYNDGPYIDSEVRYCKSKGCAAGELPALDPDFTFIRGDSGMRYKGKMITPLVLADYFGITEDQAARIFYTDVQHCDAVLPSDTTKEQVADEIDKVLQEPHEVAETPVIKREIDSQPEEWVTMTSIDDLAQTYASQDAGGRQKLLYELREVLDGVSAAGPSNFNLVNFKWRNN